MSERKFETAKRLASRQIRNLQFRRFSERRIQLKTAGQQEKALLQRFAKQLNLIMCENTNLLQPISA
jgi:hypothetical protein